MTTKMTNRLRFLAVLASFMILLCAVGVVAADGDGLPPSNDLCRNATIISGDATTFADTIDVSGATSSADDPVSACGAAAGNSHTVWYQLEPTTDFEAVFDTSGSGYDTVIAVFDGSCGDFVELVCDDDSGVGATSMIDGYMLESGQTYFVEIMKYGQDGSKEPVAPSSFVLHFSLNAQGALAVTMADTVVEAPVAPLIGTLLALSGLVLLTLFVFKREQMQAQLRRIRVRRHERRSDV
ncbi:MAG: hypothetical protein M9918_15745 [Anaerolineae bacterium]|nr:hypothetical protein [Anaerolineae bacterium]